ncbi:MAG: response regulator, partial [Gammaproteobacteria bacterium]
MATAMIERSSEIVRVMIVEDDPGMLERFAATLVRDPRTRVVEKVRTGKEALARLLRVTPDVLLVDLGLPDLHGTEVIRFAARTLPECDIMVITVFGDEHNVIASVQAGATGYVLKDCSDADLVARVLELRAGGSPMSPGIARIVLNQMREGTVGAPAGERRGGGDGAASALTTRETDVL